MKAASARWRPSTGFSGKRRAARRPSTGRFTAHTDVKQLFGLKTRAGGFVAGAGFIIAFLPEYGMDAVRESVGFRLTPSSYFC